MDITCFSGKACSSLVSFERGLEQLTASVDAPQNSCHAVIYYIAGDAATALQHQQQQLSKRTWRAVGRRRRIKDMTLVCWTIRASSASVAVLRRNVPRRRRFLASDRCRPRATHQQTASDLTHARRLCDQVGLLASFVDYDTVWTSFDGSSVKLVTVTSRHLTLHHTGPHKTSSLTAPATEIFIWGL